MQTETHTSSAPLPLLQRLLTAGTRGILINNHAQSAEQIIRQIDTLAPLVEFIGYDDLIRQLPAPTRRNRPFCLLTFDDGRAINALETAPALIRKGIPAVFYVVTAWTGTDRVLWFNRLDAIHRAAPDETPPHHTFKSLPWEEREQRIDALCNQYGADADSSDPMLRLMDWEQVRTLAEQGFEIGSHTAHHAILTRESPAEAQREVADSIAHLRQHGLHGRTLAFPNGNSTPELVRMALELGIEATVTTTPTWVRKHDAADCLPRLYLKEPASARYIHLKLAAARTGWLLKNPNGEGRDYYRAPWYGA